MSSLVLFDAMLSIDPGDPVSVVIDEEKFDPEDESIYLTFKVGEEDMEDEVCFAIDPADADKWAEVFSRASDLMADAVDGTPA